MFRDVHLLRCERRLIKVSHCANTHPCKTLCEHYFRHSVYKEAHLAMPHYETLQMWHTYSTFVCVLVKTSAVMWWHVCASRFFLSLDHRRSIQKQMWELDTNSIWAWPILRRHNTIRCYTWTWNTPRCFWTLFKRKSVLFKHSFLLSRMIVCIVWLLLNHIRAH